MAQERWLPRREGDSSSLSVSPDASYQSMCNITRRPLLSVCISTFNRAKWLSLSLEVLVREAKELGAKVELLVCDNTSTDETPDVVKPYVQRGVRSEEHTSELQSLMRISYAVFCLKKKKTKINKNNKYDKTTLHICTIIRYN